MEAERGRGLFLTDSGWILITISVVSEYSAVEDAISGLQRTVLRSKTDAMRSERIDLIYF